MLAITVVGVAATSKAARPNLLLDEDGPEFYRPDDQAPSAFPAFFVSAASRPEPLLRPVSLLLARLVPDRPVFSTLVSQTVTQQLGGVRTNAMQILAFAVVGLLLAVIGVYGVLSFDVSRRTREIGIQSALGASRARIAGNTLLDAARLTGWLLQGNGDKSREKRFRILGLTLTEARRRLTRLTPAEEPPDQ